MHRTLLNTVRVGDCMELLPDVPDAFVDLTVFSPPYDAIRTYKGEWTLDFHRLGAELMRVTKEGGVCALVIGDGTKNFAKSLTSFRFSCGLVRTALAGNFLKRASMSGPETPARGGINGFALTTNTFLSFSKGRVPNPLTNRTSWFRQNTPGKSTREPTASPMAQRAALNPKPSIPPSAGEPFGHTAPATAKETASKRSIPPHFPID